jgi:hypothetical protein
MPTKRIIIAIPDEDKLWLDGYAKVHMISVAEAIRQGVGLLKKGQRRKTYLKLVESTYGIWKKGEGLAYQQMVRGEWDRFCLTHQTNESLYETVGCVLRTIKGTTTCQNIAVLRRGAAPTFSLW